MLPGVCLGQACLASCPAHASRGSRQKAPAEASVAVIAASQLPTADAPAGCQAGERFCPVFQADPVNLRGFLTLLGRLVRGQPVECADLSQPPTKVTPVKSSMVVAKKGDYPSRFPDTLKTLTARGCSLARVGREVTSLERLSHLDLGENCLREIPAALGDLPLRRLVLAGNEMRAFPERLFEGRVRDTLEELDVSQNEVCSFIRLFIHSFIH